MRSSQPLLLLLLTLFGSIRGLVQPDAVPAQLKPDLAWWVSLMKEKAKNAAGLNGIIDPQAADYASGFAQYDDYRNPKSPSSKPDGVRFHEYMQKDDETVNEFVLLVLRDHENKNPTFATRFRKSPLSLEGVLWISLTRPAYDRSRECSFFDMSTFTNTLRWLAREMGTKGSGEERRANRLTVQKMFDHVHQPDVHFPQFVPQYSRLKADFAIARLRVLKIEALDLVKQHNAQIQFDEAEAAASSEQVSNISKAAENYGKKRLQFRLEATETCRKVDDLSGYERLVQAAHCAAWPDILPAPRIAEQYANFCQAQGVIVFEGDYRTDAERFISSVLVSDGHLRNSFSQFYKYLRFVDTQVTEHPGPTWNWRTHGKPNVRKFGCHWNPFCEY